LRRYSAQWRDVEMFLMKSSFQAIGIAVMSLIPLWRSGLALAEVTYAVVDTQRVINESIIGKAARSDLEGHIKKGQAKLSQAKADFEKQRGDLARQSSILSGQALEDKREALAKKQVELQRIAQDLQEDLARKNEVEMGKVIEQINVVVKDIAKKGGYTFIFERDKQVVVYASEKVDITADVVQALDEKKIDL
jgi:outer membrane protein